jgi:FMN phosphatase YigB (HAD superfamily)
MKVIESHRTVFFDVDDTLVIWDWKEFSPDGSGLIQVKDPGSNHFELVLPHDRHIKLLKQFKARGHTVIVWSQGGWAWAESTVKALGLESLVDVVMSKPDWYVDDLPASAYMGNNIYKHPTDKNKDQSCWVVEEKVEHYASEE